MNDQLPENPKVGLLQRDPKPVFYFVRHGIASGFLVWYGFYIIERDKWPVHDWLGPALIAFGTILYALNGNWWWRVMSGSLELRTTKSPLVYWSLMIIYSMILIGLMDAFVHYHHDRVGQ